MSRASAPTPAGVPVLGASPARASCFYEGFVRHRRHGELRNRLRYRLFMAYLDLDELPELFDGHLLWSARRPALAWFRRRDYLGDPRTPLRRGRRASSCASAAGSRSTGRSACSRTCASSGTASTPSASTTASTPPVEHVRAVVAEVTNTPWGERHAYVLAVEQDGRRDPGDPGDPGG